MTSLAVTNTLSNGAIVQASEHNTNYADIVNYINVRNSGATAWDGCLITNATATPLIVNNSTGVSDIVKFQDNGTDVFVVADGGIVTSVNQSAARAYRSGTDQTFSDAVTAKVQFNSESFDIKGEFDSATNYRFTATKTGKYLVVAQLYLSAATTTMATVYIYVNGSPITTAVRQVANAEAVTIADVVSLSATNYIEIFANLDATGAVPSVTLGSDKSYIAIHKIA